MNHPLRTALLVLFLAALPGRAQEKHEIDKERPPSVGWTYRQAAREAQIQEQRVSAGGRVLEEQRVEIEKEYVATVEIVEVDGGDWSKARIAFELAQWRDEKGSVELALADRTVTATGRPGYRTFTVDAGELSGDETTFLDEIFNDEAREDQFDPADVFLPEGPMAVGDSWPIDVRRLTHLLPGAVVRDGAEGTCRFADIVREDGLAMGVYAFEVTLPLTALEDQALDPGSRLHLEGSLLWPLGGDGPGRELEQELSIEGGFVSEAEGGLRLTVAFEMKITGRMSIRPIE